MFVCQLGSIVRNLPFDVNKLTKAPLKSTGEHN